MHTNLYVLDNSLLLKPFLQEPGASKVEHLLQLKQDFAISIFVPDIFHHEFFNALIRAKGMATAEKAFEFLTERQFSIVPMDEPLLHRAALLQQEYPKISFYDATYHALAKAYRALFLTADKKYYELTKDEGNIELLDNWEPEKTSEQLIREDRASH